ncbi:MAG TPA: leucyl/phenylalanyl-tRNA--protein transferase [Thiolapillus brandeum]|uniref:Leucyl/phenylalanyl-tRNA--protein transferase n=1 Tax=Thiolapillus brandeum TaxID=1076588 RepID=A0A7C5IZ62_9GAMM|nr:leucyl/phenylalanyl-tRNA--protein transferase [Thiolapillus brandeum]
MIHLLDGSPPDLPFPDPATAETEPDGLLAVGGDLSPARLVNAYRQGIFPWYSAGQPILWWSPDPRMVLFPERLHVSRSLRRTLRRGTFEVTFDRDFGAVIRACAAPREGQGGTWITPEMIDAYETLHRLGLAHSVEAWHRGELAGGLYGVALGRLFFGESMFSAVSDASKVAFVQLVRTLQALGCPMIDCQVHTDHLESLGAELVPRRHFLQLLGAHIDHPLPFPAGPCSVSA